MSEQQNEKQNDKPNEKQNEEQNENQNEEEREEQDKVQDNKAPVDDCFEDREERTEMVRHLIDNIELDVNALDQPPGPIVPMQRGTPIEYIPGSNILERDARDITWLLLERGADPTPAISFAKHCYPKFIDDFEAWKRARKARPECCVQ
jgi:hypothetical protein